MKRIRKSRAARILSWVLTVVMIAPIFLGVVAPRAAVAQAGGSAPSGNLMTVIVIDFTNKDKSSAGGDALARFATDAVAVEMASSARFEVLKREEVLRTANDLGYRAPYDQVQLLKIANTLGANAIVTGEVALVRVDQTRGTDKNVRVGLKVRVLDATSGDLLNGAAVIGQSFAKPGLSDTDALTQEATSKAAVQAVKQILAFTLPEGIILNTVGERELQILINRGSRDGITEGMDLVVYRDRTRVGKVRVTRVFPTDSEARPLENIQGFRPQDTVRAVFPMPELDVRAATVQPARPRTNNSIATLGKILLVVLIGVVIATTLKQGGSVTGVTAEPDLQNGTPAVQITWRDNLFGGQTLEYHIWRQPDAAFNFTGTPVAATATRQYTDQPAPFTYWDGVRSYLQAPPPGNNQGGTGNNAGNGTATTTTPTTGPLGFTPGRTYVYQVTGVVRRTVATSNNNNNQNGGQQNGFVLEDVETQTVNSGPATPIFEPTILTPADQSSQVDLRTLNFTWQSVQGADVFQVELSTDPFFKDRNQIVQLPLVFSTSPLTSSVTQTLPAPINITNNATLRRNQTFFNFVTGVPGAAKPRIYWRVGARNNNDRPGPVHWISRNPKDEDRSFRFIYSSVRSFTPVDLPPPPP